MNRLAEQCADQALPEWFRALWREHGSNATRHPNDYRELPLKAHGPTVVRETE